MYICLFSCDTTKTVTDTRLGGLLLKGVFPPLQYQNKSYQTVFFLVTVVVPSTGQVLYAAFSTWEGVYGVSSFNLLSEKTFKGTLAVLKVHMFIEFLKLRRTY